jgi:hypothetical protein
VICVTEKQCVSNEVELIFKYYLERNDRLCGLVVRVPGHRSRDLSSIASTIRSSEI